MAHLSKFSAVLLMLLLAPLSRADNAPAVQKTEVQQTVTRAIGYLQTESAAWLSQRTCAACHHAAMPILAFSEAMQHGYKIDEKFLASTIEGSLGSREKLIKSRLLAGPNDPPDPRPLARGVNMGQVFMAVAGDWSRTLTDAQKQTIRIITDDIVKKQLPDGSWECFLCRPPINESQLTDTAWIIMALQTEAGPNMPDDHRAALNKGIAWLAAAKDQNLQTKALRLLIDRRSGKSPEKLRASADELLAAQHADGGWSQLPDGKSDAFATGEILYALAVAGFTADQPAVAKGIQFLVTTQKTDGSWPMTSRGSPDGSSPAAKLLTPINCGAGSWDVLALTTLVPQGS